MAADLRTLLTSGGPILFWIFALSAVGWSLLLWIWTERLPRHAPTHEDPVEEELARLAAYERAARARVLLRFVGTLAVAAPLLGLLGTVRGMMQTFGSLGTSTRASTPVDALAGGISEALMTTQAGLLVALSLIAGRLWLTRRVVNVMEVR